MNENSKALRFYIDILHANLKIINKNEKQRKETLKKAALGSRMSRHVAEHGNKLGTQYKLSEHF